jgi:vitamin B12 transporter
MSCLSVLSCVRATRLARTRTAAVGALLALITTGTLAQVPPETVLVTGTRISTAPDTLPSPLTVLDEAQIRAMNPITLVDLLQNLPGVQLVQPGGGAGLVSFYLRGCQPNYTLFLVDGVKVTNPDDSRGGSFDLSTISIGEVERVEVIRGPQSAVYGADALCGVVNVITRQRVREWQATVGAEGGPHDWYRSSLELGAPVLEQGGLLLRAENSDQGSLYDGSTFGLSTLEGKLTLDRGSGWQVVTHGRYALGHGTVYPDQSGGPEYAAFPFRDRRSTRDAQFDAHGLVSVSDAWTLNALASTYRHASDFASPGVWHTAADPSPAIPPRGELDDFKRDYAAANAVVVAPAGLKATAGADYTRERGAIDGYLLLPFGRLPDSFRLTRDDVGVFAELQYTGLRGLTLLGSTRRDDWRAAGVHSTSSAGAVYTPDDGLTELRANWGQGFKLASFWALGNALVGNPKLLPEESRTTEFGVARRLLDRRMKVGVTVFDNRFYNEVDFDNSTFQFVNVSEVRGRGGEFEFRYDPDPALTLLSQITYVQVDPKQSQVVIRQRPKWLGSLAALWHPAERWTLAGSWRAVGSTLDTSIPASSPSNPIGQVQLGAYAVANLSAEWQAAEALSLTFAVDNLFDKRYSLLAGFPEPGTFLRLGLRYRFH